MSIQAVCREAMNRLAASGETFTELDVANEASGQGTKGWNGPMLQQAVKQSYAVLQGDYKRGKLVRYGPVVFDGVRDYARRGSKILYAHPGLGPEQLTTPNGIFDRIISDSDALARAGRRSKTNRDDTQPWANQIVTQKTIGGPEVDVAPLLRRIQDLEAENLRLRREPVHDTDNTEPAPDGAALDRIIDALVDRLTVPVSDRVGQRVSGELKDKIAEALIS